MLVRPGFLPVFFVYVELISNLHTSTRIFTRTLVGRACIYTHSNPSNYRSILHVTRMTAVIDHDESLIV